MEPGCEAKAWRTAVVLLFTVLGVRAGALLWGAGLRAPDAASHALAADPWGAAILAQYWAGATFAAAYIAALRGPRVLAAPRWAVAAAAIAAGHAVPLLYACVVLARASSLRALAPGAASTSPASGGGGGGGGGRPRAVGALFALLAAGAGALAARGAAAGGGLRGLRAVLAGNPLAFPVANDAASGLALVAVVVVVRARGFPPVARAWLAALALTGHVATCAYAAGVAARAARAGVPFADALRAPAPAPAPDADPCVRPAQAPPMYGAV